MIRHPSEWRKVLATHPPLVKDIVPADVREATNAAWQGKSPWPLVFLGEAGAGKTCAALWILSRQENGCWFMELGRLCHYLLKAQFGTLHGERSESGASLITVEGVWKQYAKATVAVIDDVGRNMRSRQDVSPHHHETLLQCLGDRLGRHTIFTSNLSLAELSKFYDDPIISRLSQGTQVYVTGDQRKPQGKTVGHPVLKDGWDAA